MNRTLKVDQMVNAGIDVLGWLKDITAKSRKANEIVHDSIVTTNENSNKIEKATEFVQAIDKKTNLLEPNASIEAAEMINKIIVKLNEDNKEVNETLVDLIIISKEQEKSVKAINESFNIISNAIDGVKAMENELRYSSYFENEKTNSVERMIKWLTSLCEENSVITQEVLASVMEQNSSIRYVSHVTLDLKQCSEDLHQLVEVFQIDKN